MNEEIRSVKMHVINPGQSTSDGEFSFEMQPRYNPGRTVKFALIPSDAEKLLKHLQQFVKDQSKANSAPALND